MSLADLGLRLVDVDLGGIDAESDTKLESYFVTTPYVSSALSGRRTLFLGRKGSGKSALFRHLPRLVADSEFADDRSVLAITPDQYAWAALKAYREQGLLDEHAHTNAWKLTLAVEMAGALVSLERSWSKAGNEAVGRLRTFLDDNYGGLQTGLTSTAASVVRGFKSFNLSAFGFGAGLERQERTSLPLTPATAKALMDQITVLSKEHGLVVAMDRLDDSWDGSDEARSLLVGLLKACKEYNDSLGHPTGHLGLRLLVFMRSDIYDDLSFDDKDKHRATEETISWTSDLLHEMVQRRLPDEIAVDTLFEPGEMRGSITPFNYIVKRTFLRPREVLQFMDECIRVAGREESIIMKDDVRAAEARYSRWKVDDLKQEFRKVFSDFDQLLEGLRQERHRYDAIDDLQRVLERKVPELVEAHGARALLERLFDYSVIGVRLSDAGSTRFKAEDSELVLPRAGAVYVHQGLHKGLNIRETRKIATAEEQRGRHREATVALYDKMQSFQPFRDLGFLQATVTPAAVLANPSFSTCARALGIRLETDDQLINGIQRPASIGPKRLSNNEKWYLQMKDSLKRLLRERDVSVEDYLATESLRTSSDEQH